MWHTFFFKLLSARREDCTFIEDITETAAAYAIKYVLTRWLSLKRACIRVIEQWDNLYECFINFLCLQKTWKEKSRKLHITNELLKTLSQNKHYPICCLYPLLLRSFKVFDTFSVKWTINPYSLGRYVHFVVELAHKI